MAGTKVLPDHIRGLLDYLSQPHEKANEDRALAYFRAAFPDTFTRQREARRADGYVPGSFILELKGQTNAWLAGLFQALANDELDFAQIVVGAKHFLAVWQVSDIPQELRTEICSMRGPPSTIGAQLARKYTSRRSELLKLAVWSGDDLVTPLFQSQPELVQQRIASFERLLLEGKKVRQKITLKNFPTVLQGMTRYFNPEHPIKVVRAFYGMIYEWADNSTVQISQKIPDQATLGGAAITSLIPARRGGFKEFAESHYVALEPGTDFDDFFARYDEAIDAIDPNFRKQHGIFFTDRNLSKFVMWLAKAHVPQLGQDYLVLDPACGSGNLVTNWRSPLELRHKVVSEIEAELLFAVEQRMKGDAWHNGKFTVVPKVSDNAGLNFIDRSAEEYLSILTDALVEKGQAPDKPLAILCNPPYRSDDDQSAEAVNYKPHPSITALTGTDASNERYCCFLAQMKLLCDAARDSGLPGESRLLLFTKSAWLTRRKVFAQIREQMLGSFGDVTGILIDGSEFFDVKGRWPVAFTIWKHENGASLDPNRPIELLDLTWVKKRDLDSILWSDAAAFDAACEKIVRDSRAKKVALGENRMSIKEWSEALRWDFMRNRRNAEKNQASVGGLPSGDRRLPGKKAYGEVNGQFVGFMDDLTPCRIKRSIKGKPWFRLNAQFMDVKKNRCLSGPPTNRGYCAEDLGSAKKLFFWYALTRTFLQVRYPMWADADDLWQPFIPRHLEDQAYADAFAVAFAENDCVETYFPANNPAPGTPEVFVSNPMTPLDGSSFWSTVLRPYVRRHGSESAHRLVDSVENAFRAWSEFLARRREIAIAYRAPYFIDERPVTRTAGLVQIRDYASEHAVQELTAALAGVQTHLKAAKQAFSDLVLDESGLNYFAPMMKVPERTAFEKALAKRLAIAGVLVKELHDEPHFGRTKLAKIFYLADARSKLQLKTEYVREAAGPLDQRALYNERIGIEALARKHRLFRVENSRNMIRYVPLPALGHLEPFAAKHLGSDLLEVRHLAEIFRNLTTEQSEIVATLYACWNDLLLRKRPTGTEEILDDFSKWHPKKQRFSRARLVKALSWMRERELVPSGDGQLTKQKSKNEELATV